VDPFFQEMLAEFEENLLKDSARLKEMVESGALDRTSVWLVRPK
jgi:hypothetical protein